MSGWIYLIKNGDLHKIGITRNFESRMRQLKPDKVISRVYTRNYRDIEKELHKRYKNVRIPQTEYFRLSVFQVKEIKERIRLSNTYRYLFIKIFLHSSGIILLSFLFLISFNSLTTSNWKDIAIKSIVVTKYISFVLCLFSLIIKSGKNLDFFSELKYRILCFLCYLFYYNIFLLSSIFY